MLNADYKEILSALSDNKVRFLVVGAYAMGVYGYVRATGDFDIRVEASPDNSRKVYNALKEFGAPLRELAPDTFSKKGVIFQIGVQPRRIDVITHIDGVTFKKAYPAKKVVKLEGIKIPFLSKVHLIKNKSSTGRKKDLLDAETLRNHKEKK